MDEPAPEIDLKSDEHFMSQALKEAHKAYRADEVPVGAVVVHEGRVIARAWNQVETLRDATAHAEMLALTAAQESLGDWNPARCAQALSCIAARIGWSSVVPTPRRAPQVAGSTFWRATRPSITVARWYRAFWVAQALKSSSNSSVKPAKGAESKAVIARKPLESGAWGGITRREAGISRNP